jgi:hypothetical protein
MLAGAEVAKCMEKFNGLGIVFSIDSFIPETYEKLRFGAKFDQVMENLRRIMELTQEPTLQESVQGAKLHHEVQFSGTYPHAGICAPARSECQFFAGPGLAPQ